MLFRITLDSVVVPHDVLPLIDKLMAHAKERVTYTSIGDTYASCILPVGQHQGVSVEYIPPALEAEYRMNALAHEEYRKSKEST